MVGWECCIITRFPSGISKGTPLGMHPEIIECFFFKKINPFKITQRIYPRSYPRAFLGIPSDIPVLIPPEIVPVIHPRISLGICLLGICLLGIS